MVVVVGMYQLFDPGGAQLIQGVVQHLQQPGIGEHMLALMVHQNADIGVLGECAKVCFALGQGLLGALARFHLLLSLQCVADVLNQIFEQRNLVGVECTGFFGIHAHRADDLSGEA